MVRDSRTIDFEELRVFDAVVRHGGITAAAIALGMSKSTVSIQISRLEKRLGSRLLERNSRRVALTREGEDILRRVQSILVEATHLVEAAHEVKASPRGVVRIAVTPALGGLVLERMIPALAERYPDISLVVLPSYGIDDLQDPSFDFAIRVGRVQDETLVAQKVGAFSRILVASPDHPAIGVQSIADLEKQPLLAASGMSPRVEWRLHNVNDPHSEVVVTRDVRVAILDLDMLKLLAAQGNGVALLPDFMVREDLANKRLARVLPQWQSRPIDVMLTHRVGLAKIGRIAAILELAQNATASILEGISVSS